MIRAWVGSLLDLVYPVEPPPTGLPALEAPFCERCGEPFAGEISDPFHCSNCRGRSWSLSRARAAYRADGAVREVIHQFKYEEKFHHLPLLGKWMEEGFERFYSGTEDRWDALVPVPLYPLRRRERGFNQAEELAQWLGKRKDLPVWKALERVKMTQIQAKLRRSERLKNQRGAFGPKRGFDVGGRRLLIIDDVFTTGATVDACARVLRREGAACVAALTVARG